jgi:hypothetical protein
LAEELGEAEAELDDVTTRTGVNAAARSFSEPRRS